MAAKTAIQLQKTMATLGINEKIGKYWVKSIIKSNSYTETYRVEDTNSHPYFLKLFLLKNLPSQLLNDSTKVVKEIEYSSILKHRNVVSFIDKGSFSREDGDFQYYITNYFNGAIISDYVNRKGALCEDESLQIFQSLLAGLQYLHNQTPVLLHNDIDASNIILSESSNEAILIDLGHISERCTGTVNFDTSDLNVLFHAKETMVGIFDERCDLFSACAVLYFMLSGKAPWEGASLPTEGTYKDRFKELWQYRKANALDIDNLSVSDKVKYILRKGLEEKADDRFASVEEIINVLSGNIPAEKQCQQDTEEKSQTHIQEQNHGPNHVEFQIKKGSGKGFEDIAGMSELKDSLNKQVVFVIKNKEVADEYKITPPNGMLLYGPPGCGKTFFAEKFAEETGFSYLMVKSSDLASSYVHGSQEKIRQLFDQAEKNSPIVVCFDEFDALVPDRSWNNVSSEEVNEFLSQMNNCSKRGIFIVATSNRPDKIDPAVLRTGRIDKMVYVPLPDYDARKEMFTLYLKGRPVEDEIKVDELAKQTEGYIASDIAYIVNDSAMVAAYTRTKISHDLLLTSISNTHPSVRTESIKQYDEIKKKMEDTNRRNLTDSSKIVTW